MKYRTITFSIVFLLLQELLSAQSDTIYYFNKEEKYCYDTEAESYKRVKLIDSATQLYSSEHYSIEGTLKSKGFFLKNNFALQTGLLTEYFKNGNKKSEGNLTSIPEKGIRGVKSGLWTSWHENGQKKSEKEFILDEKAKGSFADILNEWDSTGKQTVFDGNGDYSFAEERTVIVDSSETIVLFGKVKNKKLDGLWKGNYADGNLYCEEIYDTNGLVAGESYDRKKNKFTYEKALVMPEYKGGETELLKFIVTNVKYPSLERENDIQGQVMVKFVVDKQGKVTDSKIIRSVSPGIDREALRVVSLLGTFTPAKLRGQLVDIYYILPLSFRLQ